MHAGNFDHDIDARKPVCVMGQLKTAHYQCAMSAREPHSQANPNWLWKAWPGTRLVSTYTFCLRWWDHPTVLAPPSEVIGLYNDTVADTGSSELLSALNGSLP